MANIRTFRDLIAWQKGMDLARAVYKATKLMPPEEMYGLTSQMRRAAVSIPSNIAEGYARGSRVDYLRFLRMSRASLAELSTQYELAVSMSLLKICEPVSELMAEVDRVVQGLINSLSRSSDGQD